MAKKLQLSELKVKSFVPVVDVTEQRTAKGGYVNFDTISFDIGGINKWTEDKVTLFSPILSGRQR